MKLALATITLLPVLIAFSSGATAFTKEDYDRQCQVRTLWENESIQSSSSTPIIETSKLNDAQASQVLAAAKHFAEADGAQAPADLASAIRYLREGSEGEEVNLQSIDFEQDLKVDALEYYPGGNPYGLIFEKGTAKILAFISDADVVCAK